MFRNLDISLQGGDLLQISGVNGSGKTTLLQILTGLLAPSQGEIFWRDNNIKEYQTDYLKELLFIGHRRGIKNQLTVSENLNLLSHRDGKNAKESLQTTLTYFNLERYKDIRADSLSTGQQRRIALAKLLLFQAQLWILDEPLTGIDQQGKILVEELFNNHLLSGGIIILTTHQPLTVKDIIIKKLVLDS